MLLSSIIDRKYCWLCHGSQEAKKKIPPCHHPKDGHPPEKNVLKWWAFALILNCHGWLPNIPMMVPHQPKDGHQPKQKLQTWNLALRPNHIPYGKIEKKMKNGLEFLEKFRKSQKYCENVCHSVKYQYFEL